MKYNLMLCGAMALLVAGCGERTAAADSTTVANGTAAADSTTVANGTAAADSTTVANGTAAADGSDRIRTAAAAPAVDTILPMDTMIAHYQSRLPQVASFGDDAARSIDELIERFVVAVRNSSTAALDGITLTEAEFAYLYFPTSIYSRSPYAQPPAVNWLLMEQNSLKGRHRLLREYGGRSIIVEGHDCAGEPVVEGRNRIHEHCTLRLRVEGDRVANVRLFGSIIERDGRFKLMSVANRL